jgi:Alcohol dehydrogenase GroES-associated
MCFSPSQTTTLRCRDPVPIGLTPISARAAGETAPRLGWLFRILVAGLLGSGGQEETGVAPQVAERARSTTPILCDASGVSCRRHPPGSASCGGRAGVSVVASWCGYGSCHRRERIAMRAVVWHGRRDVQIDTVEDPTIKEPTDAIISVTSSGLCGSDLHLYEVLRSRAPRWHGVDRRRLWRDDRSVPDDDVVRQADPDSHGAGQREALGRRHSPAAVGRRSNRRRRVLRDASLALHEAPNAYVFQKKQDGAIKIVFNP